MSVYYNENDPYPAQWLRNLVAAGHLPKGEVDERSIQDVTVHDVAGYTQCHFFAGIGGWPLALRLAGWPDDKEVWTGSCPCQPFSVAGRQKGFKDDRHLWPIWFDLIEQYHPATIFGEQVEAGVRQGWFDLVFSDLEAEGYACGATVLPACGVGAPHIRQRLWFVGIANGARSSTWGQASAFNRYRCPAVAANEVVGGMAYAHGCDLTAGSVEGWRGLVEAEQGEPQHRSARELANATSEQMGLPGQSRPLGDAAGAGCERAVDESRSDRPSQSEGSTDLGARGAINNPWHDLVWLPCTDGKARPTQSGIFPLAHGVSARVGKLRAAGNAIVPQVAAEFIKAVMA